MKQLGILLLPLDGMLVHHRVPSMKQLGILLLPLDGMRVHRRVPNMKELGVLLLPLDGMLVHHRVPSMKQLGILLLPPGWDVSPSQGTQHEAARGITTLLLLDGILANTGYPA